MQNSNAPVESFGQYNISLLIAKVYFIIEDGKNASKNHVHIVSELKISYTKALKKLKAHMGLSEKVYYV